MYSQGNGRLSKVAQDLGTAVFTSSEYINLNTSNSDYVTDLYAAFLQRSPDSGGLSYWLSALSSGSSRTAVRHGFAYSLEFQGNVVRLCPGASSSTSTSANLKYVLTDVQGSARVLMNNGTIIARHDYLPFGEEIFAGVGLRTTTQTYSVTDKVRQRIALTERDEASGLDHTWFRKYDSFAGRWTTPDALLGNVTDPQSFNHYAYAANDPVNFVDPSGLDPGGLLGSALGSAVTNPIIFESVTTVIKDDETSLIRTPSEPTGAMIVPREAPDALNPAMDLSEAQKILTENCVKFLSAILAELNKMRTAYSTDFSKVFKAANDQGAFHRVLLSGEEIKWRVGGTNSIIGDPSLKIEVDVRNFGRSDLTGGYVIIHEVFHASAGAGAMYSHFEMAQAAYNVAMAQGLLNKLANTNGPGPPRAEGPTHTQRDDWDNSLIFNNVVRIGCPTN